MDVQARRERMDELTTALRKGTLLQFAKNNNVTKKDLVDLDNQGQPVIHLAAETGNLHQVADVLKMTGEKLNKKDLTITHDDSFNDPLEDDYGYGGLNFRSVLHYAAMKSQLDTIVPVLDEKDPPSKYDFFAKDNGGECPLATSAAKGQFKYAAQIIEAGEDRITMADVKRLSSNERSALHLSVLGKCLNQVDEVLSKNGTPLTKADLVEKEKFSQQNAIHAAAWWGDFKQIEEIVDRKGESLSRDDLSVPDKKGDNAFNLSMWGGNIKEIDRVLKSYGQLLEKKDLKSSGQYDRTGFHLAAEHGRIVETAEVIKENGERVNIEDVMEGIDKLSKERKAKALYDKNGTRLQQFCDAKLFTVKSLNKFWKETPDGFKTEQSEKVFRNNVSKIREEQTKTIFSATGMRKKGR